MGAFPFIDELDQKAVQAAGLICRGKIREAKRIIRELDRSCYSEGWTHARKLQAILYLQEGKHEKAIELALEGLNNSWGDEEFLEIIRHSNPAVSSATNFILVTIVAGGPAYGPVAMFDSSYAVTFKILADNEAEAIGYLRTVARFEGDYAPLVLALGREPATGCIDEHKGVWAISPFSRHLH